MLAVGRRRGIAQFEQDYHYDEENKEVYSPSPWAWVNPGKYFGTGWTMSYNLRLVEFDSGNSVRIKDGSGQWRVFYKDTETTDTRTYKRPLYFGYTLTKDLSSPDPNKVFTLTADQGLTQYFFTSDGKLTRIQDRPNGNGSYLDFSYDGNGKLTTITDVAGRTTTFSYIEDSGQCNPASSAGLLAKITDMAGRTVKYCCSENRSNANRRADTSVRSRDYAAGAAGSRVTLWPKLSRRRTSRRSSPSRSRRSK